MSIFTRDQRTVAYDWKLHVESCATCTTFERATELKYVTTVEQRTQRHEHYERVKQLAEKYPVNCSRCDAALEDNTFVCYAIVDGKRCSCTKLYYRAYQKKPEA